MTYFAKHTGSDPKPSRKEKPKPKGLKRSAIKNKPVKIKKHSDTSLRALLNAARIVFQKWIVNRDKDLKCVSCDASYTHVRWQASHFFKAEIFSGVIFNEDNVHKACHNCNITLEGNLVDYAVYLPFKIGFKRVEELEKLANKTRQYKWSREELNDIIKKYSLKG